MRPVHVRVVLHGASASAWVEVVGHCVVHQELVQHRLLDTVFACCYPVSMYLSPSLIVH